MLSTSQIHVPSTHPKLFQGPPTPPDTSADHPYDLHDKGFMVNYPPSPQDRDTVAIIGAGYVGFHLITSFAPQFPIIAFDILEARIQQLSGQVSHYPSVRLTTDPSELKNATCFLLAVPTNILVDGSVDTSNLEAAVHLIEKYAKPGSTVVVESSVAVGMTRELLGPVMRSRHLKGGMSPEVSYTIEERLE
jgi:UDP-N-acetyl-D-mannosaminuronate dehydrogenase